ncbi:ferredoxin reductase [Cellulomonas fimi]|uniref:Oxidoreductase FAD/NAD(P)-binding domain protein n=1 Tax=Cellulomonas fimi (strain ATCC 484 / DSM 20113 / JCM 1341 / CCUG 24087 / LMG 16345 / NBRC 15513 / NCIMB 8980 / NCTC 7547 / NRS-133) TaxID=590998 RepID=F4H3H2_CELFA|nr:ferredoxin reductase [Cellulomonas fimi]AEE46517.1 oxidoreductase FAD/NAD(P)-binding domain protein [Cellulomonas fimi ATCC 484]VEH33314.1 Benzoate 1,2-dioxygenase electron transfer component [Cellulomonas fimi]
MGRLTQEPAPDGDALDEVAPTSPDDVPYHLPWRVATLVARREETPTAVTLELDVPGWRGAMAGQHVDVRLTAEDGYSTQRSYSLASAGTLGLPGGTAAGDDGARIALTVQVVADGEVSPYLTQDLEVGDQIELRGPVGAWFVWHATDPHPVQLVAGGSGLVPLMSMLRTRRRARSVAPFRLLVSARTPLDAIYSAELDDLAADPGVDVTRVWTRRAPAGWTGRVGRVDATTLAAACVPPDQRPHVYVCGPTPFVETVADLLVDLGHDPERVRTERFGPTGP